MYHQNEDILKKCVADYQSKLKTMDEKFQVLKKQAEEKLNESVVCCIFFYFRECNGVHDALDRLADVICLLL